MLTDDRAHRFRQWLNSDAVFVSTGKDLRWADHATTTGTVGALVGHLDRVTGGERHLFLLYCFGQASSKALTVRQRNALLAWLAPRQFGYSDPIPADYETPDLDAAKPKDSYWLVRKQCFVTAAAVIAAARLNSGQTQFTWEVTEKQTA